MNSDEDLLEVAILGKDIVVSRNANTGVTFVELTVASDKPAILRFVADRWGADLQSAIIDNQSISISIPNGELVLLGVEAPHEVLNAAISLHDPWAAIRREIIEVNTVRAGSRAQIQLFDEGARKVQIANQVQLDRLIMHLAQFPEERYLVDPFKLEEIVAELLSRDGYEVEVTPRSKDAGIDVIARRRDFATQIVVGVQVKRYAEHNRVGRPTVQQLIGAIGSDFSSGLMVTTGFYTRHAQTFAQSHRLSVVLRDGQDFVGWLWAEPGNNVRV